MEQEITDELVAPEFASTNYHILVHTHCIPMQMVEPIFITINS